MLLTRRRQSFVWSHIAYGERRGGKKKLGALGTSLFKKDVAATPLMGSAVSGVATLVADGGVPAAETDFFRSVGFFEAEGVTHTLWSRSSCGIDSRRWIRIRLGWWLPGKRWHCRRRLDRGSQ